MSEVLYEKETIFKTYRVVSSGIGKYRIYTLSHYDGEIQEMRNKYGPIVFYDLDTAKRFVDKLL